MGRVQAYNSLLTIAKLRGIYTVLLWPKSGTVLFQRSLRSQDAIRLAGWIGGSRSVANIIHKYHTNIHF